MGLTIYQVDAFTEKPFSGNPAAVCLLTGPEDDQWMQQLAQEMNLSETAFLLWQKNGFSLRWFTPAVEVDLCGHATLASAHVLWEQEYLNPDEQARFHTRSGLLTADRHGDWIELDFPAKPEEPADAPPHLIEALGIPATYIGKNVFDYLVEVESEEIVRNMKPDLVLLAQVTARGVSLAPYWSKRLHKNEMVAFQASPRGGVLRVRIDGDRVKIAGQAVTVMRGELL